MELNNARSCDMQPCNVNSQHITKNGRLIEHVCLLGRIQYPFLTQTYRWHYVQAIHSMMISYWIRVPVELIVFYICINHCSSVPYYAA